MDDKQAMHAMSIATMRTMSSVRSLADLPASPNW